MTKFTTLAFLAIAALGAAAALPASAKERSDDENRRCLAVGRTMTELAKTETEVVSMLKEGLTADSTQEDKDTIAQLEELAQSTSSVGDSLTTIYAAAPKPSQDEMDELNKMPIDQLIDEAQKCVD